MSDINNFYKQIRAAIVIHKRDLRISLFGPVLHVVTFVSLLISVTILRNYLTYIEANGLYPMPDLFSFPYRWAIILTGVYLSFSVVVSISRERESGTLELLFYGPVDYASYVIGKYVAHFSIYCLVIVLYLLCFLLISRIAGVQMTNSFFMTVLLSVFTGGYLISIGLFISAISTSVRSATLVFLTLIVSILLLQGSQVWLSNIAIESDYYNPVLLLQQLLGLVQTIVGWLSPFSYLNYGVNEMLRGNMIVFVRTIGFSIIFCFVFVAGSIIGLRLRGVRQ
tara:strand:+ start:1256 stop:2098 length:843 start_codon:yes stop_codon:yes gene_type:complete